MKFQDVLNGLFETVYTEVEFVNRTYNALKAHGFTDETSIASVCICRDEISQSLRSVIKHIWGEAFNLSSLAGMFIAGKTGLKAAMHHAPVVDGKERYVFYALPHIAIDAGGRIGSCRREGREGESVACGALSAFQKELEGGRLNVAMDSEDVEQSLLKMRLIKEIPYGNVPGLIELTRIAERAIREDLENAIRSVIDMKKSDYAVVTGIQIHGPDENYVRPAGCYVVVNGQRKEIEL